MSRIAIRSVTRRMVAAAACGPGMWQPSGVSRTRASMRRGVLVIVALVIVVAAAIAIGTALPRADPLGDRIPAVALDAYMHAAARSGDIAADCHVRWQVIAAIGRVESNHGRVSGPRTLAPDGEVTPPIRGPVLNGRNGTQAIRDTDDGRLDGDARWDRAVGPLQFIPTTWELLGRDGNGDGRADPDNMYDAALTGIAHLCLREPGNYDSRPALRRALIAYNRSAAYAAEVLGWVDRYRSKPLDELIVPGQSASMVIDSIRTPGD